ncbi:LDH2 family malate/lactate/ureidoglycolate dehydrogenase [Saccharothrix saharensis]|uniref:LDH2 family malate/lactate/ureidoglycolate dehydrogenase n=1 Tax=Saccharothrix saharensis TaxID=571190 RepID=A0A543J534_9PSEU|nr:Ldh family oxidoreductase [Saccharothrix saharensis]TQM77953.1 LDH2 family malate/lactate/ureidoglycolate dehydrogenase [Saccharothrix saharensis]
MTVLVPYPTLLDTVTGVFRARGVPPDRAATAAEALCHGDLTGTSTHGLVNLTRLYLPLFDSGRAEAAADMAVLADRGASVLADARRTLGLWSASQAVELASARAARYGVGVVALRGATHIGCAGYHAARAAAHGMVGLVASNCGGQRIAPAPGGREPLLGTNPLAVACPAGDRPPFVLDMSTTVVPTGRVRAAARAGEPIPPGWLADEDGTPVTDPTAFDRGDGRLLWLGGAPETGAYKGFGLGLLVEVLAALVPGAATGPLSSVSRDDDIGVMALVFAPSALRSGFGADAAALFSAITGTPPLDPRRPVTYPGWREGERARWRRVHGVPLPDDLYEELRGIAPGLQAVG